MRRDGVTVDWQTDAMTENLPPVIGYIRVGSSNPGLASENQQRRIQEWAAFHGYEIVEWVEEFGVGRAGPAFERAVGRCQGHLVVAVAPSRISWDPVAAQAWNARVHAAGGQLGFVESWPDLNPLDRPAAGWVTAAAAVVADSPRIASYRRRPADALGDAGPQQQAAANWQALEEAGYEVLSVDGVELGRDPRELLDEE